jgi:nitroreductase
MTTTSIASRVLTTVHDPASVDAAIASRLSVRDFLSTPIPRDIIAEVLRVASQAASGSNMQPWKAYVLQGESRSALVDKVCAAHDAVYAGSVTPDQYRGDFDYYPDEWTSPFLERRRKNGWGLYGLLGIGRADKDKMPVQHQLNFRFFNAPVGLMFTLDRSTGRGSLIDYGMFLQGLMVAARARGLHTCP